MNAIALASSIDRVTVYRRGARVTRVAKIEPLDGAIPAAVRLEGLCLGLDDSSVRARIEAHEPANEPLPVAHDLRIALDVPPHDPALAPADDAALEDARAEVESLERRCRQIERELARLKKLSPMQRPPGPKGQRPPPSPVAARRALIEFRAERERAVLAELREARERLDRATEHRDLLEDRDRRASSARNPRAHELRKALVVCLRGGGGQPCRLVVDYVVPGARWAPIYTIKLDETTASATLAMRAQVAQCTGEDWNQVAMTLSTASAQAWTELPELKSLRIGRHQPSPPRVGWRPPPTGVEALYRDWDRAFARPAAAPAAAGMLADAPAFEPGDDELLLGGVELERAPADAVMRSEVAVATREAKPPPAPAPMAAPVAAGVPAALRSRARPEKKRKSAPARPYAPPPSQPAAADDRHGVFASTELLRYGALRMPPPTSPTRGHLCPASRHELYLELAADSRAGRVDVMAAVNAAIERARSLEARQISGCELAWADAFDHAYPATARIDVPSDGDFHAVPLLERDVHCEPLYVVVPRESPDVFSTVSVDNPLDAPLLPGPVDVHVNGTFLLASQLDVTPARGRFSLGLGVEQAIKVARNTRFAEETTGLMGGSLALRHHIAIEIRNNLPRPVPLEVRERIPVANEKDDDVEVRETKVSPPWEKWEQDLERPGEAPLRGGRRWRVNVAASGREQLFADYEIKISAKHELGGGNRREA